MLLAESALMQNGKELREKIEKKLTLDFLTPFQKEFLESILWRLSKEWDLTEKQSNLLQKIFVELDDLETNGYVWDPTDTEKLKIDMVLTLAKSYSSYYLCNHNPSLKRALASLLETHLKISTGARVLLTEKRDLDKACEMMKSKLEQIEKPKFLVGDLVFVQPGKDILGVIIAGPNVSKSGNIFYVVDLCGTHVNSSPPTIKKAFRKKTQ